MNDTITNEKALEEKVTFGDKLRALKESTVQKIKDNKKTIIRVGLITVGVAIGVFAAGYIASKTTEENDTNLYLQPVTDEEDEADLDSVLDDEVSEEDEE